MRVKSECKNKDKKKSTQSARSARSAQSARSAVCSLQSAWSAFWGDRIADHQFIIAAPLSSTYRFFIRINEDFSVVNYIIIMGYG